MLYFCLLLQKPVNFWFATGGAGFCVSRGLALKMSPWARWDSDTHTLSSACRSCAVCLEMTHHVSLSFQWRSLHEHGGENPSPRRLHHRLHHRVGARGPADPQQPVPLPPGEPATGAEIWDSQTGEMLTWPSVRRFALHRPAPVRPSLLSRSRFHCCSSRRSPSVMGCLKTRAISSIWKGLFLWRRTHPGERAVSGLIPSHGFDLRLPAKLTPPSSFCLPGSSRCTVSCTQTPRGVPLRLPFRATAPFSSSSPSCLGIWKAQGDQCSVLDRAAAVAAAAHGL